MAEEEMTFDSAPGLEPEPLKKKLSRLKRACPPSDIAAETAVQPLSPAHAAMDVAPHALSDRTNLGFCPKQASHPSPTPVSPTQAASEPPASPCKSVAQSLQGSDNEGSDCPGQSAAGNDYWDSEDELEVELTRRERAEGFHADSATSSEGKAPGENDDSEPDSPAKSCSPNNYEELNSQTQRVLRDSAKRDTIGQGHAIQRQPLSGVLGKILTRKDAVVMRAPVVPVKPVKQGKQAVVSPPGLASRLHSQAGELVGHAEEPEDQDLLVMSDADSDGGPLEDPVLADADLFLKQAKKFVAQHKTIPPHQNRLGLAVGSASDAPQTDTQDMGLDSIPFEEPELFRARSGLPALPGLAEKEHSSLELRLDSQDLMDGSPDQEDEMIEDAARPAAGTGSNTTRAANRTGHDDNIALNGGNAAVDDDADIGSGSDQDSADDEQQAEVETDASPSADGDIDSVADAASPTASQDEQSSASDDDEEAEPASQSGADSLRSDVNSDSQDEPDGTAKWQQAGQQQQGHVKASKPIYNQFVDEEAEMSEDEGHSQGDAASDSDDDADLEGLIGQGKDRAGDESRRARLHQQWLEQQDAQQVAQLMAGVRNGFRRKRAGDLLDEDVGTDYDTRKRRACRDGDEESLVSDEEEEDQLAGLLRVDEDDSDDAGLDEHEKEQLRRARALKGMSVGPVGSIDLDAGSQEILALLSAATHGDGDTQQNSKAQASLVQMPSSHQPPPLQKTSFMGRSVPALTLSRAASQMASRSYVFGKDDSNSAAPPTDGPGATAAVNGPTSFSGLENMLGESTNTAGSMAAALQESKEAFKKPSLLGRLAGTSSKLSPAAGSMSANDLQHALASSFGARAAAKANNAMKRR